jgi:hypothetical protein
MRLSIQVSTVARTPRPEGGGGEVSKERDGPDNTPGPQISEIRSARFCWWCWEDINHRNPPISLCPSAFPGQQFSIPIPITLPRHGSSSTPQTMRTSIITRRSIRHLWCIRMVDVAFYATRRMSNNRGACKITTRTI